MPDDLTTALAQFLYSRVGQIGSEGGTTSGVLDTSTTQADTLADTNETDLWTYTLPANTLSTNGRTVRISAFGTYGATANAKTVKVYFGATVVGQLGGSPNGGGWTINATVVRSGASAQVAGSMSMGLNGATINTGNSAPAENTAGAITIKVTGQNGVAAASDISFRAVTVELLN